MKTIVTHQSCDLDAITACWLIKKFLPGWEEAVFTFVPAGSTFNHQAPDKDENIIHVDTGLGRFDHHQTIKNTSAAKLVFNYLVDKNFINKKLVTALERLVSFVNEIDHFHEVYFPEAIADRYDFTIYQIIEGLRPIMSDDKKLLDYVFVLLEAELNIFRNKVKAEDEIKKGFVFTSNFGRSLVMETKNEEALKVALKMGYGIVARKDPDQGNIRIKTRPAKDFDLSRIHKKILQADKKATWFLHVSGHMLLNSSSKNPNFVASGLSLKRLIEIIREV